MLFFLSCFVVLQERVHMLEELDAVADRRSHWRRACETAYKAVMKPKEGTHPYSSKRRQPSRQLRLLSAADDLEPFFVEIFDHAEKTACQDTGDAAWC